jgi:hypothetical protein
VPGGAESLGGELDLPAGAHRVEPPGNENDRAAAG